MLQNTLSGAAIRILRYDRAPTSNTLHRLLHTCYYAAIGSASIADSAIITLLVWRIDDGVAAGSWYRIALAGISAKFVVRTIRIFFAFLTRIYYAIAALSPSTRNLAASIRAALRSACAHDIRRTADTSFAWVDSSVSAEFFNVASRAASISTQDVSIVACFASSSADASGIPDSVAADGQRAIIVTVVIAAVAEEDESVAIAKIALLTIIHHVIAAFNDYSGTLATGGTVFSRRTIAI